MCLCCFPGVGWYLGRFPELTPVLQACGPVPVLCWFLVLEWDFVHLCMWGVGVSVCVCVCLLVSVFVCLCVRVNVRV